MFLSSIIESIPSTVRSRTNFTDLSLFPQKNFFGHLKYKDWSHCPASTYREAGQISTSTIPLSITKEYGRKQNRHLIYLGVCLI